MSPPRSDKASVWPLLRAWSSIFPSDLPHKTSPQNRSKDMRGLKDEDDRDSESDDLYKEFRDTLIDRRINPLLLAMARAAACMPKLQHMTLGIHKVAATI